MRNLWYGSWVLLVFTLACSTSRSLHWETAPASATFRSYFDSSHTSARYKAEVSIYGKHLSGLLFFKFSDDTTCQVAFVTMPGAKLFDMVLTPRTDTVYECFSQLNKPGVIRTIQKDIRTFLMLDNYTSPLQQVRDTQQQGTIWRRETPENIYHFYQREGEPVNRVKLLTRNGRKKVELTAANFHEGFPGTVHIRSRYTLTIHLTQL